MWQFCLNKWTIDCSLLTSLLISLLTSGHGNFSRGHGNFSSGNRPSASGIMFWSTSLTTKYKVIVIYKLFDVKLYQISKWLTSDFSRSGIILEKAENTKSSDVKPNLFCNQGIYEIIPGNYASYCVRNALCLSSSLAPNSCSVCVSLCMLPIAFEKRPLSSMKINWSPLSV